MLATEVRKKILEMLPMKQNEVWKKLPAGRQMVSDVVKELEAEKLIRRIPSHINGVNTFMLEKYVWKKAELKQAILPLLPCFQENVWKTLGLEHRRISKLVRELQDEGLLVREVAKHTFWLIPIPTLEPEPEPVAPTPVIVAEPKPKPKKMKSAKPKPIGERFAPLLNDGVFAPCTGCDDECEAATCEKLGDWACASHETPDYQVRGMN